MEILPMDIVVNILSRLPVNSLLRFKSVCKSWLTLINSPAFADIHLSQSFSSNSNRLLIISDSKSGIYSFNIDSPESPVVKLPLPRDFQGDKVTVLLAGSYNCVLCLSTSTDDLILLNPSTQYYKVIPKVGFYSNFGLGFDSVNSDCKIVRIYNDTSSTGGNSFIDSRRVMIYSLKNDSWKRCSVFHCDNNHAYYGDWHSSGVLIDTHLLHWVMRSWFVEGLLLIGCFNVCNEEWSVVPLPDCFEDGSKYSVKHYNSFQLGVWDGCLCFSTLECDGHDGVWVMKDYGVAESWVKVLDIPDLIITERLGVSPLPLCDKEQEILLGSTANCFPKFYWYDFHKKKVRDAAIQGICGSRYRTVLCWSSFASINGSVQIGKEKLEMDEEEADLTAVNKKLQNPDA